MEEERKFVYDPMLFRSLPVPTLIINADIPAFTIRSVNSAVESLLNVSEHEIAGHHFSEIIFKTDDDQQPDWIQYLTQVCERKQNVHLTSLKRVFDRSATQTDQFFDILFTPVEDEQGALLHIIATITDVTDKVTARQHESVLVDQLIKKDKFLNETQRVARNGTWEIDLNANKVLWSDMMREIHEIDADFELSFETTLNFYKDDETRERLIAVVQEAIATGGMFDIELQIITAKGSPLWVRSTGKADLTGGVCTRLYGATQDITERKKIENALIESRNRHESLIQSIEGIVWEADARTFEFNFVSTQVQSILGYTPEEWLSDPYFWSNHIYHEDRARAVNFCMMQTKEARSHTFDYRMIKADGSIVWIKDVVSVIMEDDKPSLLRGIMVDITETKLLEDLDHLEKQVLELNSKQGIETETVLEEYVEGLEKLFPSMKCSVLRVKDNKVYDWVSPSLPQAYVESINSLDIGPNAGSCGTSAYLKEKVIVTDIETDIRWADYKHLALPHNLRSCWSFPIVDSEDQVIAVLGIYYENTRIPDTNEIDVLERSVSILNVILENRFNAEMILEASLLIAQGQELANFGNWQWDIDKNLVTWSDVLYKIYGLDKKSFPATFEGYVAMLHPEDRERVTGIIRSVLETHKDIFFEERIIRPDGEERCLKSWGRVLLNEEGKPVKMIGACLDITTARANQTKLEEIAWLQSHVIRAPLARLIGLVNILQNELREDKHHEDLLQHILQTAHELDDVVRTISNKTEQ